MSEKIGRDLVDLQKQLEIANQTVNELQTKRINIPKTDLEKIKIDAREYVENQLDITSRKEIKRKREIAVHLRSERKKTLKNFKILPFDIFPKGTLTISDLVTRLRSNGRSISVEDERKLHKIDERFPNSEICLGKDGFKGWVIFRFKETDVVIAEKPAYGHATYLIKGDWEEDILKILPLSRGDARKNYPRKVKRVIHTSEYLWLAKLESKFNYWY